MLARSPSMRSGLTSVNLTTRTYTTRSSHRASADRIRTGPATPAHCASRRVRAQGLQRGGCRRPGLGATAAMSDVDDPSAGIERAGADADVAEREEIEHEVGDDGGAQPGA